MAKIAVLGYGTVGSGIVEVLNTNKELIRERVGEAIDVKYILDLREFPGDPYESLVTHDFDAIAADPEVSVVCEAMGGTGAAYKFTKACLEAGKSVCTSNKALVAEYGTELMRIAKDKNCSYLFEASCGGGIPIIRPIRSSLCPERILAIKGILNGTTNYILTRMEQEGADFADVLKQAQELGYAEADPTADIEGHDACRKIAILSSLAYGKTVYYQDVETEGITKITTDDFAYMKQIGATIKLLGMSKEVNGAYYAQVAPFVLKKTNPLYSVNGVMNAILVTGNTLGDTMYYGAGAGSLPTASAVVSDVMECVMTKGETIDSHWSEEKLALSPLDGATRPFFVRVKERAEADIKAAFGEVKFLEPIAGETAFITAELSEAAFKKAAAEFEVISFLRVED
ncbi:MAG: homoserine dehydrogenase [Lachnospiraceae bacterium]|nr:homoserine dehydrogenase [Lachnospiraceae bacterium]